jgi:hypothetical protein
MSRVVVAALVVAGCAPKEIDYQVKVVTQSCDAATNPFEQVTHVQMRVSGDGIEPALMVTSDASSKALTVPKLPSGANRVIEVRAYAGDPSSGGKLVSVGRSLPFDVPDVVPDALIGKAVDKPVILRKVNTFTPVVSADAPSACGRMKVPRAGHTATLLKKGAKNGMVFIAGGFNLAAGTTERVALADTELYNPATGAFDAARDISFDVKGVSYKQERAFHTATLIPHSGQVVLWGGELYASPGSIPSPRASFLFYDPSVDQYGALPPRNPAAIRRSRHAVALTATEKLLIVGGISTSTGTVVSEVEWLDPETASYKILDGVSLPVLGASVAAIKKGEFIAVAGGAVEGALSTEVSFFRYNGSTFVKQPLATPPQLAPPGRRDAAAAVIHDGADMIVLGGSSSATQLNPVASSELIVSLSGTVAQGPNVAKAADICAVSLLDGSVMTIGGRTVDVAGGPARSESTTIVVRASDSGALSSLGGPELPIGRWAHTCTLLLDGSVLVTGGLNETASGQQVLQDAWVYMPAPTN